MRKVVAVVYGVMVILLLGAALIDMVTSVKPGSLTEGMIVAALVLVS